MTPQTQREDDQRLFERCQSGDVDAYGELYDHFGRALFGTALRMLGRPEEAEEIVQEAFIKLYRSADSLRLRNLGGWLHRVTANACIDRIRSRKHQAGELYEFALTAAPGGGGSPAKVDLERAVQTLPPRARKVFLLHDVEGFRHREVAALLQISEGTSKSQLFRARELLRAQLQPGAGS